MKCHSHPGGEAGYPRRLHGYPDARIDGRPQAGKICEGPLAPHQDHRDIGRVSISEDDLPAGGRFLPKPYSPSEVVQTLRELLAS